MNIAGLILAGGKNTRMGGVKKAYLCYNGKYFYECAAESMASLDNVYLSVENQALYPAMAYPMIEDIYPGIGPLGGIYSAFTVVQEEALMVLPCDVPRVTGDFVNALIARWQLEGRSVMVGVGEKLQPLIGVYERQMLPFMEEMIETGDYRMRHLITGTQTVVADIRELGYGEDMLLNVNSSRQLDNL